MRLPRPLRDIVRRLPRAAVFSDYVGTLAPIVDDPRRAISVPGTRHVLSSLARRAMLVMVVTGRPTSFVRHLGVPAIGQHGHEEGPPLEAVARAAEMFDGSGFPVELKSHMLTVHYRAEPHRREEAMALAERVAAATGLLPALAKMGVELRPSALGKGDVVRRLARGAGAAVYAGDDLGDIPAFLSLRQLRIPSVSVAVLGKETPDELLRSADVVCPSPFDWVSWLRSMATS